MGRVVNYVRHGKPVRAAHLLSTQAGRDGRAELVEFATRIGLSPGWLQKRGTVHEHFDVIGAMIERAIATGVARVDNRGLGTIIRHKREQLGLVRLPRNIIRARSLAREART